MAKYASCSRAHGTQKATPRICTTAPRGQGLSVLLRTWQAAGIAASVIIPFFRNVSTLYPRPKAPRWPV
jgi:hypothetical protein